MTQLPADEAVGAYVPGGYMSFCTDCGGTFSGRKRCSQCRGCALRHVALNTPELEDFARGVVAEAQHQRARWPAESDAGKEPEDWLWLLGWLAGKVVRAVREGDTDKAKHHCISSAAVLGNWHANLLGADTAMRPGTDPAAAGYEAAH